MVIHKLALADVTGGMTDGITVFDDILAFGDVTKGELMTSRNARQILQGYRDRVGGVDLKKLLQRINRLTKIQQHIGISIFSQLSTLRPPQGDHRGLIFNYQLLHRLHHATLEDIRDALGEEVGEAGDGVEIAVLVPDEVLGGEDTFSNFLHITRCP